jgi:hypothetical protein
MAMGIIVVRPGDGDHAGGGSIRCRIVEDGSHTEHCIGLIEATVPPGPASPPQQIHRQHDEIFIGTMTPDLYVEYFRDLSRLPVDDRGMLNLADVGRAMANYATEAVLPASP